MRFAIVLLTLALSAGLADANDEDAKLAKFFKSYLDEEFKHRPLEATRLGDSRYDDVDRRRAVLYLEKIRSKEVGDFSLTLRSHGLLELAFASTAFDGSFLETGAGKVLGTNKAPESTSQDTTDWKLRIISFLRLISSTRRTTVAEQ